MPIVSGNVYFDKDRSCTFNTGDSAIANVPVVLQNTTTNVGVVCLTATDGSFQFNNVPSGTYRLVEAWGTTGGGSSPVDFSSAAVITAPTPKDPPFSVVTSPPTGTNAIDSTSPNTINLTIASANSTGNNFLDGPVIYTSLGIMNNVSGGLGANLITVANNGNWGTNSAGQAINTSPSTNPYSTVVTGFGYQQYSSSAPADSNYSVVNIAGLNTFSVWWNITDHTSGDETGRFCIVNGANPGSVVFTQDVTVIPNTYYYFSTWFLNMIKASSGFNEPSLSINVITAASTTVFNQNLQVLPSSNTVPNWVQVGSIFNSGNNTTLKFRFLSQGASGNGNDYAIDDISLNIANINQILAINKTVDYTLVGGGDTLTYTLTVTNTQTTTAENVVIVDTLPNGTSLVANSVYYNNVLQSSANPNTGISLGNILGSTVNTLLFKVKVTDTTLPNINPMTSASTAAYFFTALTAITVPQYAYSNIVSTTVTNIVFTGNVSKVVNRVFSGLNTILTYTIPIRNVGNTSANNTILLDTMPSGTVLIPNTLNINGIATSTYGNPLRISLETINVGASITIEYKVQVTTIPTINPIVNYITLTCNYTVFSTLPNSYSQGITAKSNNNVFKIPSLYAQKQVTSYAKIGDTLIYTIPLINTSTISANNIVFVDTLPNELIFVNNSLTINGVTSLNVNPISGLNLGNLSQGTTTIAFKATVSSIPSTNFINNSAYIGYQYTFDPTVPNECSSYINTSYGTTEVRNPILTATKTADKRYLTLNDVITYTISVSNTGNVSASNIVIKDTIPQGLTLIANSLAVNGAYMSGDTSNINLGTIVAGGISTITFKAKVL